MGLSPAQRAALMALLDDNDDDAGEALEDVAEALDELADAVDELGDTPPPVVVVDAPPAAEPGAAEVAVIEAGAEAQIAVMRAEHELREAEREAEAEREREALELLPDVDLGLENPLDALDELLGAPEPAEPDDRPVPLHRWFRPMTGGRR